MGVETKIEWCHHTFNGWIGCTEAGPECDNCYAREQNKHWKWNGGEWGPGALRKITSSAKWREPLKWNKAAKAAGERRRVFAFSLADVADAEAPQDAYPFLWQLVEECDWLDFLFLTKRPARIVKIVPKAWLEKPPKNVWWGTSVGTQKSANALIPSLLRTPAAVRFLSMEPLLEEVDLDAVDDCLNRICCRYNSRACDGFGCMGTKIDWVILGGESGDKARPMRLDWMRSVIEQSRTWGTKVFVKQLGGFPAGGDVVRLRGRTVIEGRWMRNKKGGDMAEWPADLRIREFPEARRVG